MKTDGKSETGFSSGQALAPSIAPRADDGRFYAVGEKIFKAPLASRNEDARTTSYTIGFLVCTVSEFVTATSVADILNAGERFDILRDAMNEARELLLERTHGSPARSAAHNARLVIEAALSKAQHQ